MTYRWIEDIREFKDIAKDWDDALIASGSGNPFLLSDFIITWWKHFYRGSALRIFFVHNGNKIAGGIPLCIKRGGPRYGFARMLSHIGGSAANYTEPLYSSLDAPVVSLLREALSQRRDWDVFYLSDVRPESKVLQESISSSGDKRFLFYLVQDHMNLAIDLSGGLDNYLASISKK